MFAQHFDMLKHAFGEVKHGCKQKLSEADFTWFSENYGGGEASSSRGRSRTPPRAKVWVNVAVQIGMDPDDTVEDLIGEVREIAAGSLRMLDCEQRTIPLSVAISKINMGKKKQVWLTKTDEDAAY